VAHSMVRGVSNFSPIKSPFPVQNAHSSLRAFAINDKSGLIGTLFSSVPFMFLDPPLWSFTSTIRISSFVTSDSFVAGRSRPRSIDSDISPGITPPPISEGGGQLLGVGNLYSGLC